MLTGDFPPNPPEKLGYRLEFSDEFDSDRLNLDRWVPYYLPHWSSRERTQPSYHLEDGALTLRIDADQAPWSPEFDGEVKCSALQTGLFAGQVGSSAGQLRFNQSAIVREAQIARRTYLPLYGFFETRVKAPTARGSLGALWMIGFEEDPQESGEICIFEVFGDHLTPSASEVRCGVHPWSDPRLTEEFYRDVYPINAAEYHIYAAEWTPTHIDFYVDNVKRRTIHQSPTYPMQFMLTIYELPGGAGQDAPYPRCFTIDYFRGYQPLGGY